MAYFSTKPAPGRRNVNGKNRVWDFFPMSSKKHPANRRQPLQPRRKICPTATKIVSGIPYWPARDPIGERGGSNLYVFLRNRTPAQTDALGLINYSPPPNYPYTEETGKDSKGGPCLTSECGADITKEMDVLMDKFTRKFNALGVLEKTFVCATGVHYWDIDQLHIPGQIISKCGDRSATNETRCANTATYKGKCHTTVTLNYILFGKMMGMCGVGQNPMDQMILEWKWASSGDFPFDIHHTYWPSSAWALWAYPDPGGGKSHRKGEPKSDRPYCKPCTEVWRGPFTAHFGKTFNLKDFGVQE